MSEARKVLIFGLLLDQAKSDKKELQLLFLFGHNFFVLLDDGSLLVWHFDTVI